MRRCDDAEFAVGRRVERENVHVAVDALHDELGEDRNAELVFYHRDDRGVVHIRVADDGRCLPAVDAERGQDVKVEAGAWHEEVLAGEVLDPVAAVVPAAVGGQDCDKLVVAQVRPAQPLTQMRLIAHYRAVKLVVADGFVGADAVAHRDGDLGVRTDVAVGGENGREPLPRDARVRAEAQCREAVLPQLVRRLLKPVCRLAESAHGGQQLLPGGREMHAALTADKQIQPQFVLKRVHHMRQPRLRVAKFFRRGGEAAAVNCC